MTTNASHFSQTMQSSVSAADHEAITAAIRAAESQTSGQIFAVVAHASDGYGFVSGFMAALWTVLGGLAVALAAWAADWPLHPLTLAVGQAAGLGALLLVLRASPALRIALVPRSVAYRRASANAARQFMAHGIHATNERTGVLLFVSLAERYAEVVADTGINAVVGQESWNAIVAMLVDNARNGEVARGFIEAVDASGALLAAHFPPQPEPRNELDDRLIEI